MRRATSRFMLGAWSSRRARSTRSSTTSRPGCRAATIIPWDKDDIVILAELFRVHLIKLDLLGLGMLKVISRVFEQLEARGEEPLRLHGFRYDERVFDGICKGDTIGLFQIESRAQISFLPRLAPRNLSDVAISVGAIRPGPGATGAGGRIALRRRGLEPITYPHPDLKEALEQTSGVLLWQEQAMQVAKIMAGYTLGEAEQFRRAMTHKRSYEAMEELCEDMVQRMLKLGRSQSLAEEIRRMVIGFAGYGFPRAHAYPFAHLALVSATLKLRYPAEYLAAMLNSQPMGFYAPHTLIWDASRHGVRVLPVDVNASSWECALEDGTLIRSPGEPPPPTPSPVRGRGEQSRNAPPLPRRGRGLGGGGSPGALRVLPTCSGSASTWCAGWGRAPVRRWSGSGRAARTARWPISCGGPGWTATPSSGWPRSGRSCASTSAGQLSGGLASWPA